MEKLIELLQIYDNRNDTIGDTIQYRIENGNVQRSVKGIDKWVNVWWYSKSFGFIKWLVENEKIDFEGKLNTLRFESLVDQTLDSYLALLMLLSIQDEPINFLLEILK